MHAVYHLSIVCMQFYMIKLNWQQYKIISLDDNAQMEDDVAQIWPQINFLKMLSDLNREQNSLTDQRQIQTSNK